MGVFFVQRPVRVVWCVPEGDVAEADPARLARLWAQTWLALSDKLGETVRGHPTSGDDA